MNIEKENDWQEQHSMELIYPYKNENVPARQTW